MKRLIVCFALSLVFLMNGSANSLTEMRGWKLKNGTLEARIIYLSENKAQVFYAGIHGIIKVVPLASFEDAEAAKIKQLDKADKRPYGHKALHLNSRYSHHPYEKKGPAEQSWPPQPNKGWQIKKWDVGRISLQSYKGSRIENFQSIAIGAALWWHESFTFRHKEVKRIERFEKALIRKFMPSKTPKTSAFVPEGEEAGVLITSSTSIKPHQFHTFMGGNAITAINLEPFVSKRSYGSRLYLIKETGQKGIFNIYYRGERLTGSFEPSAENPRHYVFKPKNENDVPEWIRSARLEFRYGQQPLLQTFIPIEKQVANVKWRVHPVEKTIEKEVVKKPVKDAVVLPDHEIKFLDTQRPLRMEIHSTKGKSTIATLHKIHEGQVTIKKRNSSHKLDLTSLDFATQMKAKFWQANKGIKLKLPACRLLYKVRNKKRGYDFTFTICYDGQSRCLLTTQDHNEKVYFNSDSLIYAIYKSEKGRLLLKERRSYFTEHKLSYPKIGQLGDNRKNYPSTTASDTNGYADRVIMSKSTTMNNHRNVSLLKAAHVEAQPVVQFIHGFSNIKVPSTQAIARSNFSLVSAMRLLYENATLPMEMHWKQTSGPYHRNEPMELTLQKISPLEDNFFHQFEVLEAARKAAEEKRKAAEQE